MYISFAVLGGSGEDGPRLTSPERQLRSGPLAFRPRPNASLVRPFVSEFLRSPTNMVRGRSESVFNVL